MSLTTQSLIDLVNDEVENHPTKGSAAATGDGEAVAFLVAPTGSVISSTGFSVYIDGTLTTAYTMDYDSGVITFTAAPASDAAIAFNFSYSPWSTAVVTQAVSAAIDNLFPAFYAAAASSETSDGATYEFEMDSGVEFVTSIDSRGTSSDPWIAQSRSKYTLFHDGLTVTVRFYSAPSSGTLRFHTIGRPAVADLPDRARDPIISYACWYLITQRMAPRVRADVAVATQGTGTLSPRQMADAANAYLMRYQFQLAAMKMIPWRSA